MDFSGVLYHLRVVSGDLLHCGKSTCGIMLGLFEILFFFFHMQVPKVDKMSPSERMCVCVCAVWAAPDLLLRSWNQLTQRSSLPCWWACLQTRVTFLLPDFRVSAH